MFNQQFFNMKLEHYVIENSVLSEDPLHAYDTPLDRVWGKRFSLRSGYYETSLLWLNGPAEIFVNPEGKIAILSKSKLSRWHDFKDMRSRRYINPVRIVDITKTVNVKEMEKEILGTCQVPGCNETALYEFADPVLACSPEHMRQLCGYEGKKRRPLNVFNISSPVKVYLA